MSKEIVTKGGSTIRRISRWIKIRQNYSPNKRNPLWYYVTDGNGYREGEEKFNIDSGLFLDYFVWNGRKWAIGQFLHLSYPMMWEDENGKICWISGYDSEDYYNPILIELDENCEMVRVYEEVKPVD